MTYDYTDLLTEKKTCDIDKGSTESISYFLAFIQS